jgi:intracellular sulfur oxidation DsrE/DsrF family protein
MMLRRVAVTVALCLAAVSLHASGEGSAPWGQAKSVEKTYSKQKVVYDVSVKTVAQLENVLDRASHLSVLNDADPFDSKIVIVLHGDEIGFFAIGNFAKYRDLMTRAQSLTVGGTIDIRMCRIAARRRGFDARDIHGFVTMVPMADAEIIDLQKQGFAYMQ